MVEGWRGGGTYFSGAGIVTLVGTFAVGVELMSEAGRVNVKGLVGDTGGAAALMAVYRDNSSTVLARKGRWRNSILRSVERARSRRGYTKLEKTSGTLCTEFRCLRETIGCSHSRMRRRNEWAEAHDHKSSR